MNKLLLKIVYVLFLGIFYPSDVAAFVDEFDDLISLDHYNVSSNSGTVEINSGKLILSALGNSQHFPYVTLKNQYLSDVVTKVSIDFRYQSVGIFGAGVVIDDNYPNNGTEYDVGKNSIAWTWNWGSPPKLRVGRYPFLYTEIPGQNLTHNLTVRGTPGQYEILLDGAYQGTTNSTKSISSVWFGNPEIVETNSPWPTIEISRIEIESHNQEKFPYFSQKDPAWKDLPYDNASVWAGESASSIERWGCAITSVAMMLDKYDIKMPNGDVTNPEKINTWLKSQPDGYVGNGLLNWLAISRLVKQARLAGQASTDLEFIKSYGSPSDELSSGLYPIINEGGHFVTLFDQDADNWILNDPNDKNRNTKAKTEPIVSVNTYKPSNTDLSYILLVYDQNIKLDVSYGGSIVGSSFVEYINDDVGSNQSPTSNLFYYAEPDDGAYRISVDTANDDSISIYTYDELGNVDVVEQQVPSGKSSWELMYIDNGTDPVIRRLDNDPPVYIGTNKFDGWYNAPQTAVFNFEDANLPSDFVIPSCVIKTEGKGQFCKISTNVCDSENNCKNYDLESNRANIDLTPPKTPKYVMALGFKPYSLVSWSNSKEAERYLIEWGVDKNNLQHKTSSKNNWEWINTPKNSSFYYRVTAMDKAGNLSKPTPIYRVVVKSVIIRW